MIPGIPEPRCQPSGIGNAGLDKASDIDRFVPHLKISPKRGICHGQSLFLAANLPDMSFHVVCSCSSLMCHDRAVWSEWHRLTTNRFSERSFALERHAKRLPVLDPSAGHYRLGQGTSAAARAAAHTRTPTDALEKQCEYAKR